MLDMKLCAAFRAVERAGSQFNSYQIRINSGATGI
jgi:hypothetical protein